eukprot:GHVQ01027587.1.p1 GENE.GHVQ01027587.1~~GHVQ01027587.1.p1  ORF type:complete len:281 (+),score=37.75 GHVQ01027587.1:262-1104(+)
MLSSSSTVPEGDGNEAEKARHQVSSSHTEVGQSSSVSPESPRQQWIQSHEVQLATKRNDNGRSVDGDGTTAADRSACVSPETGKTMSETASELHEYRRLHHARYERRISLEHDADVNRLKELREKEDEDLARELQESEQRYMETRLAADAEYSRQLYDQLNEQAAPNDISIPTPSISETRDGGDESIRSPMRTGYAERLIDDSPLFSSRNPSSSRLLGDHSGTTSWNPFRWLEAFFFDEEDRRTGWRVGPFLCTRRIIAVYLVLMTSLVSVLVLCLVTQQ